MSRQFDVYPNPLRAGRVERPYLVDLQHRLYSDRASRVVAPLVVQSALLPEGRLNPVVQVLGQIYYFSPTEIFTITAKHLHSPIANIDAERSRIIAALDLVFTGI